MATIEKHQNKSGITYRITVSCGCDSSGKRIRRRTTFRPPPGMTPKQAEKAAQRAAADFERSIELGYSLDNSQSFAEYADYALAIKERSGIKIRTLERYQELMARINEAIGHIKLTDLRPQHLNAFYNALSKSGVRISKGHAIVKMDIAAWLKERKMSRAALARRAGISAVTVSAAVSGQSVSASTANAVAEAMGQKPQEVFDITFDSQPLSPKTVLEYHRLIHTILELAEKEMLIPYNAAEKATAPRYNRPEPNYFQPETISAILEAAEKEPLKWYVLVHLISVTGCRRGELAAIKWSKIDFENRTVCIDRGLVSSKTKGLREEYTKTRGKRTLKIPQETIDLLRQLRTDQLQLQCACGDRWQHTNYIFTGEFGRPIHPDSITGWLNDFSKRHGLPHVNPHAFRHSVASILLANGTDILTVSKHLGHADPSTTGDIYGHLIEEAKVKASDCLADVVLRKKG